jgi:hypothetical protein
VRNRAECGESEGLAPIAPFFAGSLRFLFEFFHQLGAEGMEPADLREREGEDLAPRRADAEDGALDGDGGGALHGRPGDPASEQGCDFGDRDALPAAGEDGDPAVKELRLRRADHGEAGEHLPDDVLPEELALDGDEVEIGRWLLALNT